MNVNNWDKIWKNREMQIDISSEDDVFATFCKLKRADGFDTQEASGYYEEFFSQWKEMESIIKKLVGQYNSVFEIGCGSGVNLYLFEKLIGCSQLGGIDYSEKLLNIARKVVQSKDIKCKEAIDVDSEKKYDIVISDRVFQYFQTTKYGMSVLEKMYNKANKCVIITEIHDIDKKNEHLDYRRQCVENYDVKYEGLDKTFYSKEDFIRFANDVGAKCLIKEPKNQLYWNNKFVFDCYIVKQSNYFE